MAVVYRVYVLVLGNGDLYVGSTAKPLVTRVREHRGQLGRKGQRLSARACRQYGVRKLSGLTPRRTYTTRTAAEHAEQQLAKQLQRRNPLLVVHSH